MQREVEIGRTLADTQPADERDALESDPWAAIPSIHGLTIDIVSSIPGGGCSIDGRYDRDAGRVEVVDRSSGRRMSFTLLHELGHHLLQTDDDCVGHLLEVRQARQHAAEEDIADAFAAEILIPSAVADEVLGDSIIRASRVAALFERCPASRSACAVRAAHACRGNGYVMVSAGAEVIHAATFGDRWQYPIRRGTRQPDTSAIVMASQRASYRSQGRPHFPSGATTPTDYNLDAVTIDGFTFAIFSDKPFTNEWETPAPRQREPQEGPEVTCTDCCEIGPSWRRCERCDAYACAACGSCPKCSFKKAKVKDKLCPGCFQTRPIASFPDGAELCTDFCT